MPEPRRFRDRLARLPPELRPVVISLCDRTGIMVRPWADAGFECWCVDVRHSIRREQTRQGIHFVWGDVRSWTPPASVRARIGVVFAFPPCTHMAASGARDFRRKGTALLRDSLELFTACEHAAAWSGAPYLIENPVGKFSDHMGPPDFIFDPWQFGDPWTKKTCLWTGNSFVMPKPTVTTRPDRLVSRMLGLPPSPDRADLRSETPPGFARVVFAANADAVILRFEQRH